MWMVYLMCTWYIGRVCVFVVVVNTVQRPKTCSCAVWPTILGGRSAVWESRTRFSPSGDARKNRRIFCADENNERPAGPFGFLKSTSHHTAQKTRGMRIYSTSEIMSVRTRALSVLLASVLYGTAVNNMSPSQASSTEVLRVAGAVMVWLVSLLCAAVKLSQVPKGSSTSPFLLRQRYCLSISFQGSFCPLESACSGERVHSMRNVPRVLSQRRSISFKNCTHAL